MKRPGAVVVLSVLGFTAQSAAAQESAAPAFGGSVVLVTDYRFRGISQTLREMAVQAGIDVSGPAGLYAGVWGSNLNFGEVEPDGRAQAEVDVFGGIERSLGDVMDVGLGVTYYGYPGAASEHGYGFVEAALSAGRDFSVFEVGASAAYSPDYFGGSGSATYLRGDVGIPLGASPFSLAAGVGRQWIEKNESFGTPDYTDWSVGLVAAIASFEAGVAYVGTDIDKAICEDICRPRAVVSLTYALGGS